MLRILREMYSAKHRSYNEPFVHAKEAKAFGVQPAVARVRLRFQSGEIETLNQFATEVL